MLGNVVLLLNDFRDREINFNNMILSVARRSLNMQRQFVTIERVQGAKPSSKCLLHDQATPAWRRSRRAALYVDIS